MIARLFWAAAAILALFLLALTAFWVSPAQQRWTFARSVVPVVGGAFVVATWDADAAEREVLQATVRRARSTLNGSTPAVEAVLGRGDDAASIILVDLRQRERAARIVGYELGPRYAISANDAEISIRFTEQARERFRQDLALQIQESLRRRLNATRRTPLSIEVDAAAQRVRVETVGGAEPAALGAALERRGVLTVHMVREVSAAEVQAGALPPGTMFAAPIAGNPHGEVVQRQPRISGNIIAQTDPTFTDGHPGIVLRLNETGQRAFCEMTRSNLDQRFAILIDGEVASAPQINDRICGQDPIISGAGVDSLAALLEAPSLPAQLTVVEQGSLR